jgi:hypothetical protein
MMPTVMKISTPVDRIVAGDRVSKTWGFNGSGERFSQHWIVRADDDSDITINITNPQLGDQAVTFKAADGNSPRSHGDMGEDKK